MSIESVVPSNHLILCHLFSFCLYFFPASGSFPMSQPFTSGGQSIGASASASVLPVNIQDWFPLGLTGLTSLQFKGLSKVFSNTRVFSHESALPLRWPKYWSFSISPSKEYSRLISFRTDYFDPFAVHGILESSPAPQVKSINSSVLSLLCGPTHICTWQLEKS